MKRDILFCICATLFFSTANAKEIEIMNDLGQPFAINVEENETFFEVAEKIHDLLFEEKGSGHILLEMPLPGVHEKEEEFFAFPIAEHGGYLGHPRNYYANVTNEERESIRFIVLTLSRSLVSILTHKSDLEAHGDRVNHVHPLRFLECVFISEELKAGIRNIRGRGRIWSDFASGIKSSLSTESNINNMKAEYVYDFAKNVKIDPNIILPLIQKQSWDQFVDTLITHIPRKGNHNRYDS